MEVHTLYGSLTHLCCTFSPFLYRAFYKARTNFPRSWGSCRWFDRHQKWVEVSLHFKLELNTLDESLKNWGWVSVGALHLESVCKHIMIQTFFLVLVWGTHPWSLFKHFRYTLYIPLDDVNITNRCDVCLQQRTILRIQDAVQLWKHLYKGASVKSLHNKYYVKNDNIKLNFSIEEKISFEGMIHLTKELICGME